MKLLFNGLKLALRVSLYGLLASIFMLLCCREPPRCFILEKTPAYDVLAETDRSMGTQRSINHASIADVLFKIDGQVDLAISRSKQVEKAMTLQPADTDRKATGADSEAIETKSKEFSADVETVDFTITLRRSSLSEQFDLQLEHDVDFQYLVIKKPSGKPMAQYQAANPKKQVRRCDQIVSVNGTTGDALAMILALQSDVDVTLVLRRYVRFTVSFEFTDESLGLKLKGSLEGVTVMKVLDGPIKEMWNGTMPCCDVCIGDELAEVNGMATDCHNFEKQLFNLQKGKQLRLVFLRRLDS